MDLAGPVDAGGADDLVGHRGVGVDAAQEDPRRLTEHGRMIDQTVLVRCTASRTRYSGMVSSAMGMSRPERMTTWTAPPARELEFARP